MLLAEVLSLPVFWPVPLAAVGLLGRPRGIALSFMLRTPSRWVAGGGRPEGCLQAAGGGKARGDGGLCTGLAGALAELADSTCPPWAARKSSQHPGPAGEGLSHMTAPAGLCQRAVPCSQHSRWRVPWARPALRSLRFPISPMGRAIRIPCASRGLTGCPGGRKEAFWGGAQGGTCSPLSAALGVW